MNVELTMTNEKGQTVCERERYGFEELRRHPGFSDDERRCYLDLVCYLGAVEWKRAGGTVRVARIEENEAERNEAMEYREYLASRSDPRD